jgi:hypothetical protein
MKSTITAARCVYSKECPEVEIKVAASRREREQAFRLAYHSYLRAGLCSPNSSELRVTPFQLLSTTDIIVAELRGEVISTISLVRDGVLGLPMESIYPDELKERRRAGVRMAEASCLADRRQSQDRFFGIFCEMNRIMVQLADREGYDQLLIAVHPRHARMYCRAMAFAQVGGNKPYPSVNGNPAVALCLDFHFVKTRRPAIWARFVGESLPESVLQSCPLSGEDRAHFKDLCHRELQDDQFGRESAACTVAPEAELFCA